MSKKIKGINEFQEDDWNFNLDKRILSEEEKDERCDYINKMTSENLKNHPKKAAIEFMTLEEFREEMESAVEMDGEDFSEEDLKELNEVCMEHFGKPFRENKDL